MLLQMKEAIRCTHLRSFCTQRQMKEGRTVFDICPKMVNAGIKPKAPLHIENRNNQKEPKIEWLSSGMVLMKDYISIDDQVNIVKTCREVGVGEGGFYQPYFNGRKMRLQMMCLGLDWDVNTRRYSKTRFDNAKPPMIPDEFRDMVEKSLQDSNAYLEENQEKLIPSIIPDICIVNFYSTVGRLGHHQDKDESRESLAKGLPVVSFSIGDTAKFLYNEVRNNYTAKEVELESGDVLIFGGKSRRIFHGVDSILPGTAPKPLLEATHMSPGRLNLTFRKF